MRRAASRRELYGVAASAPYDRDQTDCICRLSNSALDSVKRQAVGSLKRSRDRRLTESVKLTGLQFTDVEAGENSHRSSDMKVLGGARSLPSSVRPYYR